MRIKCVLLCEALKFMLFSLNGAWLNIWRTFYSGKEMLDFCRQITIHAHPGAEFEGDRMWMRNLFAIFFFALSLSLSLSLSFSTNSHVVESTLAWDKNQAQGKLWHYSCEVKSADYLTMLNHMKRTWHKWNKNELHLFSHTISISMSKRRFSFSSVHPTNVDVVALLSFYSILSKC